MMRYVKSNNMLIFNGFKLKCKPLHGHLECEDAFNIFMYNINPLFKDVPSHIKKEIKEKTYFESDFGKWNITRLLNRYNMQEIDYSIKKANSNDFYDSGYALTFNYTHLSAIYVIRHGFLHKENNEIFILSPKDDNFKSYKKFIEILSKELR